MTATNIEQLIEAIDLGDDTDRQVLADALIDAGREGDGEEVRGGKMFTLEAVYEAPNYSRSEYHGEAQIGEAFGDAGVSAEAEYPTVADATEAAERVAAENPHVAVQVCLAGRVVSTVRD